MTWRSELFPVWYLKYLTYVSNVSRDAEEKKDEPEEATKEVSAKEPVCPKILSFEHKWMSWGSKQSIFGRINRKFLGWEYPDFSLLWNLINYPRGRNC